MQERQILFRIALTRALYDQMAPQLCPFYVPGKLSFSSLVFVLIFSAFLMSGKHLPEERKTPIGPIHIVFLLGPTQTSFSFPPAGTPEATSWEQGQMARPQLKLGTSSQNTVLASKLIRVLRPKSYQKKVKTLFLFSSCFLDFSAFWCLENTGRRKGKFQ